VRVKGGGLSGIDSEVLSQMLEQFLAEKGFGGPPPSLTDLFEHILAACAENRLLREPDLISDWIVELQEARISSNGGDLGARKALEPQDMLVLGKTFADADLPPPAPLQAGMAQFLADNLADEGGGGFAAHWAASLKFDGDAFDMHQELRGMTFVLPAPFKIAVLKELVHDPLKSEAAAGFLFDPDTDVAVAVAQMLAETAKDTPARSAALERLALVRPWLAAQRQAGVDKAIAAMRRNALPAEPPVPSKLLKCQASVCDGSGALQLSAALKAGKVYRICAIMIKPQGVADAFVVDSATKGEMDRVMTAMAHVTTSVEIDLPALARILSLGLANNLASGLLPPFRTAQVVEALSLGPTPPQAWSPEDLCRSLLDELPQERRDAAALAQAHAAVGSHEASQGWFEAGEAVASVLRPLRGKQKRVKALLEQYLPVRRTFWARQCALTALVLSAGRNRLDRTWPQFALVGADLVAVGAASDIPLMKKIADASVQAFQQQEK
jgi:hypothetical protein